MMRANLNLITVNYTNWCGLYWYYVFIFFGLVFTQLGEIVDQRSETKVLQVSQTLISPSLLGYV